MFHRTHEEMPCTKNDIRGYKKKTIGMRCVKTFCKACFSKSSAKFLGVQNYNKFVLRSTLIVTSKRNSFTGIIETFSVYLEAAVQRCL